MTRRRCPPRGVPAVTRAYHYALAQAYDRERYHLVLAVNALRNGREWVRA